MVDHGRLWSTLVDQDWHWSTVDDLGRPWSTFVDRGRPWSTLVDNWLTDYPKLFPGSRSTMKVAYARGRPTRKGLRHSVLRAEQNNGEENNIEDNRNWVAKHAGAGVRRFEKGVVKREATLCLSVDVASASRQLLSMNRPRFFSNFSVWPEKWKSNFPVSQGLRMFYTFTPYSFSNTFHVFHVYFTFISRLFIIVLSDFQLLLTFISRLFLYFTFISRLFHVYL